MEKIDICFKLIGKSITRDYAYPLYGGISRIFKDIHWNSEIGIHPVAGKRDGNRLVLNGSSFLILRVPSDYLSEVVKLSGEEISIVGDPLRIAFYATRKFLPHPNLMSQLVTIKGFMEPELFLGAVQRQLDEMQILAKPFLIASQYGLIKRRIVIKDKRIVGFPVAVMGLSAEESLRLQDEGLGGRRHFGCGIFVHS